MIRTPAPPAPPASPPPSNAFPAKPLNPDVSLDAALEGYFGATGTGKSTSIKRRLAAMNSRVPVVVFDPKHEYGPTSATARTEAAFIADVDRMADHHAPVMWALLRPSFDAETRVRQFDRFCRIALAIARSKGGCIVVIDELHLVTDSSRGKIPAAWLELVNTGRAYGVHILAASIRPQSIDMDFRSSLTYIRAGRLGEREDCERVASKLMIDWRDVAGLANLEYFERDLLHGTPATRGRLEFS